MTHHSNKTQAWQNYFDHRDPRSRELPFALDGQLLNAAACSLEESETRLQREIDAQTLAGCPSNLDNQGLYFRNTVPISLQVSPTGPSLVEGLRDGAYISLQAYDDTLPVPTGIEGDFARTAVACSSPMLFTYSGTGLPQSSGPLTLAIPNRLCLMVSDLGDSASTVQIILSGHTFPRGYWAGDLLPQNEALAVTDEGLYSTQKIWQSIDDIQVIGLPDGATLQVLLFVFGCAYQPDDLRPLSLAEYRDQVFRRYWTLNGQVLNEVYAVNRWSGFEVSQSYQLLADMLGFAVEPNTYGLFTHDGKTLYYSDRREPLPSSLNRAVITAEPMYSLRLAYDQTQTGPGRAVTIHVIPHESAGQMFRCRLSVDTPNGGSYAVTTNGTLAPLSGPAGWLFGSLPDISLLLPWLGTYVFTLECADVVGNTTADVQVYANLALAPLAQLDTSALAPQIAGLGFDARQRPWIWTGTELVPVKFRYDAFVYDAGTRSVYTTDKYDTVRLTS